MIDTVDRTTEDGLVGEIDRSALEAHIDALADLRRYPGTDDQWEAAEYIVDELGADGVDVELQTVEAYTSVPVSATVTVTSPVREVFEDAITTAFSASTPPGGVSGELVAVDAVGHSATDLPDLSGKIVFTEGLPTPGAVRAIDEAGAQAAVFQSPTEGQLHEMIASPIWGSPSVDDVDELPDLPVAEIHQRDGAWLAERLAGDDVAVTVETQARTEQRELPCPVARIEGTESDRYTVVGNHIDSWHEGVTDNASAVATSMELARVFAEHPPKRGIVVGFWPGHSMGRYAGSARYADRNWLDLRENGVAYIHIDLNGLDGADHLWAQHMAEVGDEHLDVLADGPLPMETARDEGGLLGGGSRPGRNSDQSFWGAGLSSLLSGARFSADHEDAGPVGGGWWWHTPEDTRDKIDFDLMAEEARLYTAIVSRLSNSPVLPHDYRETAAEIRALVEQIDDAAAGEVDFSPVYDRLDRLDAALDSFAAVAEGVDDDGVATGVEDVQVRLGNLLIPALYMESPAHEHDPALPHELLPYLRVAETLPDKTGPRAGFARTKAVRGVSKLAHNVEEAADTVEAFLDRRA
ncbi:M28 family peptidase [Halolamina rubra]|uniref:M28 family peptidase n=1 Tax=Halolamina rubra TaxID=1380430 RepID=UPI0006784699|nr:M28 family peptidase [Halolamina rubra]